MKTDISEDTKVKLGFAFTLAAAIASAIIAVSVSMATTKAEISTLRNQVEYDVSMRDKMFDKVSAIDARTARIEGLLEARAKRKNW